MELAAMLNLCDSVGVSKWMYGSINAYHYEMVLTKRYTVELLFKKNTVNHNNKLQ